MSRQLTDTFRHHVVFTPLGLSRHIEAGSNLLTVAQDAGVSIRSLCGGNGKCRQCWIEISEGSHTKHGIECSADNVSPVTELEQKMYQLNPKYQGLRLACRTHVVGDLLIDVPESSQENLAYISKKNDFREFSLDPVIRLIDCELEEATMDDNPAASEKHIATVG